MSLNEGAYGEAKRRPWIDHWYEFRGNDATNEDGAE